MGWDDLGRMRVGLQDVAGDGTRFTTCRLLPSHNLIKFLWKLTTLFTSFTSCQALTSTSPPTVLVI